MCLFFSFKVSLGKIFPIQLHELLNLLYPKFFHTLLVEEFLVRVVGLHYINCFCITISFSPFAVGKLEMLLH